MTQARNLGAFAATASATGTSGSSSSTPQLVSGLWTVSASGTKLTMYYNGTAVFSVDSSGNIISKADVTGYGTP